MSQTLPDNRMRFPAPEIDFDAQVGTTGQDHDTYPLADTQARFDWMRMVIISLLANQSACKAPTQYREGTIWYDTSSQSFKVWMGDIATGAWEPLSKAIIVGEPRVPGEDPPTLWDFYQDFLNVKSQVG